jgi:hypothetical protein
VKPIAEPIRWRDGQPYERRGADDAGPGGFSP